MTQAQKSSENSHLMHEIHPVCHIVFDVSVPKLLNVWRNGELLELPPIMVQCLRLFASATHHVVTVFD